MIAETISLSILANSIYDMLKHSINLSAPNLRSKMQKWVIGEDTLKQLERELERLGLNSDMSELAIERRLEANGKIPNLIKQITPNKNVSINQINTFGDNIGRDKIVH